MNIEYFLIDEIAARAAGVHPTIVSVNFDPLFRGRSNSSKESLKPEVTFKDGASEEQKALFEDRLNELIILYFAGKLHGLMTEAPYEYTRRFPVESFVATNIFKYHYIKRDDVIKLFKDNNIHDKYFNPETPENDFMNPDHPRYAPELAAAVAAWKAFDGKENEKTTVADIETWLKEHAGSIHGLLNPDKNEKVLNDTKAERIATVVNWNKGPGKR